MRFDSNKKYLFWLKWAGTILCTIGISLTSFNKYPYNIFVLFVGTAAWLIAGVVQKDWALAAGELVSIILYISGITLFIYMNVL
jgi:hypothetical protein